MRKWRQPGGGTGGAGKKAAAEAPARECGTSKVAGGRAVPRCGRRVAPPRAPGATVGWALRRPRRRDAGAPRALSLPPPRSARLGSSRSRSQQVPSGRAGERASERAREERVHFCPGVSETRPPQAQAKEHRGSGSASSEKPGEGSQRWDRSAPAGRGAREPGQRGKPRGARPGRAPGAAQDAARRAAVAATSPLRLNCG